MSFSSEVKEELGKRLDTARHCQIAEFAAIMAFCGKMRSDSGEEMQIEVMLLSATRKPEINPIVSVINKNITAYFPKSCFNSLKKRFRNGFFMLFTSPFYHSNCSAGTLAAFISTS